MDLTIWEPPGDECPAWERHWRRILCIVAISLRGMRDNGLFSRAAGLSYGVMMALGPMVAIAVWISTAFIQADAETQIKRLLVFISPSLQELVQYNGAAQEGDEAVNALDSLITQIVIGAEGLIDQVNTAGSKAFGTLGGLVLIWLVIQLMTSIEHTFNSIWGVRKGRPWGQRIVTYWTFISLGAVLGLGATALVSASNLAMAFEWVPFGRTLTPVFIAITPFLSFLMLVILLSLFYMFFPHTQVRFKPAFAGACFTAVFLMANNYLSILYIHRVVSLQSLYGSLGIIPVLMIGLYFFWIFILLGGQMTFSVQNVQYLANQQAWNNLSARAREVVTLSVFLFVARRYHRCEPAPGSEAIGRGLHAPVNTVNQCVSALEDLGWLAPVRRVSEEAGEMVAWQPAIPLDRITLAEFHEKLSCVGNSRPVQQHLLEDPVIRQYSDAFRKECGDSYLKQSFADILAAEQP